MNTQTLNSKKLSISDLRKAFTGQVIAPGDAEYDSARTVFYGGHDRHPAVIIRPVNAAEVAQVIALARETGLELAVRGGGHSLAGHAVTEGGIVLDLSAMRALEIDVEGRTAWAEAGLTAGEYTAAAGEHGLATGFGDTGSVGIGGITLGGGIGYLVRKYGLTIDDFLAADLVTADGELLQVDSENHPDLFWALRGGGGNFGVVTRFKYRLHEVPSIVGGMLLLPASPETIHAFMEAADAAPEELSTIANVMVAPPMPFVPPDVHGKFIIMAMMVYAGDEEAGQRAIAPFRAIATPVADMIRPMTYAEMYPPEEGEFHPVAADRTFFMDDFDRQAAETVVEYLKSSTAMMAVAQLRVLGGAMARVPVEATAFAHRNRKVMVNVAGMYMNPNDAAAQEAWVDAFMNALRRDSRGAYVNFLENEGEDRVREAYPGPTWDRLAAVKRRYDPTNLFHVNHNISPK